MSLQWFRMYTELVSDPKVQLLAFEDQRHFVMLLCLKGNGTLDSKAVSAQHFDQMICKALGLDLRSGLEAKRRLIEVGLIDDEWQPIKWDARQYDSDSSTARTRKWREKQRTQPTDKGETSRERHGDVTVTPQNRIDTEQNRTDTHDAREASVPDSPLDQRQDTHPSAFEQAEAEARTAIDDIQREYPLFTGRQDWINAEHACRVRISEGVGWPDLLAGVRRYAAFVRAGGVSSQRFVMTPGKFFSAADKPWAQPWTAPEASSQSTSPHSKLQKLPPELRHANG